jgi:carbon monoxide dehydrogenase subunit G
MRIEGAYTFPAPVEQVVSALTHPDLLSQIIPGCERLIQLGPAPDGQPSVYELRLRRGPDADVYTMNLTLSAAQAPRSLTADLDGRGPDGPFSGHGQLDLTQQDGKTLVTSVWDVKSPVLAGMPAERQTAWNGSTEAFAGALRDRAASVLRGGGVATSALSHGMRHLTTPRGRVVILPQRNELLSSPQARRVLWLGGGLLAGLAAAAAALAILRRLTRANESLDTVDRSDASDG